MTEGEADDRHNFKRIEHVLRRDCCSDQRLIDMSKVELPFDVVINVQDINLWISLVVILFYPLFWNVAARWEYRNQTFTDLFRSPKRGCIVLAVIVFSVGVYRAYRFSLVLESQPQWPLLYENWILLVGYGCILIGVTLVLTSFWSLGFYGTFLGDYFGILWNRRVTDFPYNVISDPMYVGATLCFVGWSLIKASQTGILLSIIIGFCYGIVASVERPFTAKVYSQKKRD